MSKLIRLSRRIGVAACKEYIRAKVELTQREQKRETDAEIREALARHGWLVAESAS